MDYENLISGTATNSKPRAKAGIGQRLVSLCAEFEALAGLKLCILLVVPRTSRHLSTSIKTVAHLGFSICSDYSLQSYQQNSRKHH